jgi:hypothetical protein
MPVGKKACHEIAFFWEFAETSQLCGLFASLVPRLIGQGFMQAIEISRSFLSRGGST